MRNMQDIVQIIGVNICITYIDACINFEASNKDISGVSGINLTKRNKMAAQ